MNYNNQYNALPMGTITYPSSLPIGTTGQLSFAQTFACGANNHVFTCDHALTCKCGKATRPAPVPCPHCS
jgi:hypothetical protein